MIQEPRSIFSAGDVVSTEVLVREERGDRIDRILASLEIRRGRERIEATETRVFSDLFFFWF